MREFELGAQRARDLLHYSRATGALTWKVARGGAKVGDLAGSLRKDGYIEVRLDGTLYLAHRVALLIATGRWPAGLVDHRNGDRADNRRKNLRDGSRRLNQENQRHARSDSTTGVLGVSPKRGKFRARIKVCGVERSLGCHSTVRSARSAYLKAKRRLHSGCTI